MGRFARSLELTKQSYRVLMQDKELLLLPVLSGLAILAVIASFAVGIFALGGEAVLEDERAGGALAFCFYVVSYTVAFFFQAALIAGALERMAGGDPTLGSALAAARRRLGAIVLWGVIAGTVGMLLRALQERSELLGRIVLALVGAAWSLATWFMVPVLVMEREPIGASFKRSAALFQRTFGEAVIGNLGFGLIQLVIALPIVAFAFLLAGVVGELPAIVVGGVLLALMGVFFSALQGVFVASLYRYATSGEVVPGFERQLLAQAFRRKP